MPAARADPARGVDLLCLYTQAGGWRARATGRGPAPGLWPPRPARDRRWQPALAA